MHRRARGCRASSTPTHATCGLGLRLRAMAVDTDRLLVGLVIEAAFGKGDVVVAHHVAQCEEWAPTSDTPGMPGIETYPCTV